MTCRTTAPGGRAAHHRWAAALPLVFLTLIASCSPYERGSTSDTIAPSVQAATGCVSLLQQWFHDPLTPEQFTAAREKAADQDPRVLSAIDELEDDLAAPTPMRSSHTQSAFDDRIAAVCSHAYGVGL